MNKEALDSADVVRHAVEFTNYHYATFVATARARSDHHYFSATTQNDYRRKACVLKEWSEASLLAFKLLTLDISQAERRVLLLTLNELRAHYVVKPDEDNTARRINDYYKAYIILLDTVTPNIASLAVKFTITNIKLGYKSATQDDWRDYHSQLRVILSLLSVRSFDDCDWGDKADKALSAYGWLTGVPS